jgi:NTP pyrophosphatase (non-canonical NTP hydrolase)
VTTIDDISAQVIELKAAHGFGATTLEQQLAFLTSEVGEVARAVLHLQSTQEAAERETLRCTLGMELYDVLWNVCAIAELAGIELEHSIEQKAAMNRTRSWSRTAVERAHDGR